MLSAQRLLEDVIHSLRTVIAPAIPEQFPKSQAYMAAVILEFVSRQVQDRGDIAAQKQRILRGLRGELSELPEAAGLVDKSDDLTEADLSRLIEALYSAKSRIGDDAFSAINQRVRHALRQLLDEELKVAGSKEN